VYPVQVVAKHAPILIVAKVVMKDLSYKGIYAMNAAKIHMARVE
jgi:hypothetical protein